MDTFFFILIKVKLQEPMSQVKISSINPARIKLFCLNKGCTFLGNM